MRGLRLGWMLARLGWLLLSGALQMRRFPRLAPAQRDRAVRRWSAAMLAATRTALVVHGRPAEVPCMLAMNHVSWLDIMGLNAAQPSRFVAKSDVHTWPVLGRLAQGAGTLFIERDKPRDAMRVMHDIAALLRDGARVSVFPEGTTSDGRTILPLHANLFQAAVSAGCAVQPVLLRYVESGSGAPSTAAAYIDADTVIDTLRRIAAGPRLQLHIHYLEPVPAGADRRALAAAVQQRLQQALDRPLHTHC